MATSVGQYGQYYSANGNTNGSNSYNPLVVGRVRLMGHPAMAAPPMPGIDGAAAAEVNQMHNQMHNQMNQMKASILASGQASADPALHRLARLVKAFQGDVFGDALWCCPALVGGMQDRDVPTGPTSPIPSYTQGSGFTSYPTAPSATGHRRGQGPTYQPGQAQNSFILPPPIMEPCDTGVFRCRLSPDAVLLFLSVLRVDYAVKRNESTGAYALYCLDGCTTVRKLPMELNITIMPRREWTLTGADFDIDMLAMDSHRVYTRPCAQQRMQHVSDPFSYLLARLRRRTFCLSEPSRSLHHNQRAMARAFVMVAGGGWCMDDALAGDRAWVICAAKDAGVARLQFRGYYSVSSSPGDASDAASSSSSSSTHSSSTNSSGTSSSGTSSTNPANQANQANPGNPYPTCALCRETVRPDDIIVHLGCGHAFHYMCQPNVGGLSKWIETDNGNTCPCCRSVI